jgi:Protein of unknown function (DUF3761)
MQQAMFRWIETADARAALADPGVVLVARESGVVGHASRFAALFQMRAAARYGGETIKRRLAMAAVLICVLLGGGIVAFATIGAALELQANTTGEALSHATARCGDGTWSWSKNPAAPETCANHGGVAMASR